MKTIKIIQQGDRYMAYASDDKLLLPTPFSPRSRPVEEVRQIIQSRNPEYLVIIDA